MNNQLLCKDSDSYIVDLAISVEQLNLEFNNLFANHPIGIAHIKDSFYSFCCRPNSSDIAVLIDTFRGLYHLPLAPLPYSATVVDLGSNIGCTLVHLGAVYPSIRLIGVELDSDNYKLAINNTELLGKRCHMINAAIWSSDQELRYTGQDTWGYKVDPNSDKVCHGISMATIIKELVISKIDYLKVDIEGGEQELFSKNLDWLSIVQQMHVEVHDSNFLQNLAQHLKQFGFKVQQDRRHWSALYCWRG